MRWGWARPKQHIAEKSVFSHREGSYGSLSIQASGPLVQEPIPGWPWQWLVPAGKHKIWYALSLTNMVTKKCLQLAIIFLSSECSHGIWLSPPAALSFTRPIRRGIKQRFLFQFPFTNEVRLFGKADLYQGSHVFTDPLRLCLNWFALGFISLASCTELEPKSCPLSPWSFHLPQENPPAQMLLHVLMPLASKRHGGLIFN